MSRAAASPAAGEAFWIGALGLAMPALCCLAGSSGVTSAMDMAWLMRAGLGNGCRVLYLSRFSPRVGNVVVVSQIR